MYQEMRTPGGLHRVSPTRVFFQRGGGVEVGSRQLEIDPQTGRPTGRTRPAGPSAPCPGSDEDKKPYGLRHESGYQWRLVDDRR